jgi:hypothetical protein
MYAIFRVKLLQSKAREDRANVIEEFSVEVIVYHPSTK